MLHRPLLTCIIACVCSTLSMSAQPAANPAPADAAAPASAFGQSLALRMDRVVADQSHSLQGWLAQTSPVSYAASGALHLTLALYSTDQEPKLVKNLGQTLIFGGNLANQPFPISINLQGVPDGAYQYSAEVRDGDTLLKSFSIPVHLVAGIDAKQADFEQRLAKIPGHDGAKAAVLYPFDLARVINLGKRVYGSGTGNPEFGLDSDSVPTLYDFTAGLKKSADLVAALEAGHDPMWQARGESVQYYHMPEADEILPYHVFVPSTWDGKTPLPLVFILHGNSRDQDFYFYRDGGIIPKTAEKHGYMLVAPLGYSPNGGYNYVPYGRGAAASTASRGLAGASAAPQNFARRWPVPAAAAVPVLPPDLAASTARPPRSLSAPNGASRTPCTSSTLFGPNTRWIQSAPSSSAIPPAARAAITSAPNMRNIGPLSPSAAATPAPATITHLIN